jgi:hypothetical protein
MKRSSAGDYLLLRYNCSVPFPAASQCSHSPCNRRVNLHGFMQATPVVPNQSIWKSATQGIIHPGAGYCLGLQYHPFHVVGLQVPIFGGVI